VSAAFLRESIRREAITGMRIALELVVVPVVERDGVGRMGERFLLYWEETVGRLDHKFRSQ